MGERPMHFFDVAGHGLQALVEVDGDAVGRHAAEAQPGRKGGGARRRGAGQQDEGGQEEPAGAATHERRRVTYRP